MGKILNNWELKVFALLAAMALWVFVVGIENSVYKFPGDLEIQPLNMDKNVSLATELPTVNLYIKDDKDNISSLTKNDFTVYVDLAGLKSGEFELPVSVTPKNTQVRVLRVEPGEVKVKLSPSAEKVVKVAVKITGNPQQGYEAKDYKLEFETVKIMGAQAYLDQISEVDAVVALSGTETGNVSQNIALTIPDAQKTAKDYLQIVPAEVLVNLTVEPKLVQKEVKLIPKVSGVDNTETWLKLIKLVPATITIETDEKTADGIDSIETGDIDINKFVAQGNSLKVGFELPQGIKEINGVNSVTVKMKDDSVERKTLAAPVALTGKKDGVTVSTISPPSVQVTVSGAALLINNLQSGSVTLNVDLAKVDSLGALNLTKSDFNLPVGLSVTSFYPNQITLQ